jgi:hypothetical protein
VLPGPGEAVHCLLTGRFDLMHLLVCVIERLGTVEAMRISTLSFNLKNLSEMLWLLDSGAVRRMTLLSSVFHAEHDTALVGQARAAFCERGQRVAAARCHAKVVTFAFASGKRLTVESSANCRSNGNIEFATLADGAGLHDWHARWIDELVTQHAQSDEGDHPRQN